MGRNIDAAVQRYLADKVQNQILLQSLSPHCTVVPIDCRTGPIHEHVPSHRVFARDRFEVGCRLLDPHTDSVNDIPLGVYASSTNGAAGKGGSNVSDGAASGRAVATGRGVGSASGAPEGASGCDVASASGACEIYPCSGRAREV